MTPTPAASRWSITALAVLAGIIAALQVGKVPPALPLIADDLGLSRVTAGLVASLFFAAGAGFGIGMGALADRYQERRLLLAGLLMLALGSLLGGLIGDTSVLLVTRVIEGLGFTVLTVAAPKIIATATRPPDQPLAFGIWSTFMPAGMAAIMVLSPALLAGLGWQGVWLLNAAVLVVAALTIGWGLGRAGWADTATSDAGFDWPGMRALALRPGPWLFGLCFVLYTMQWFAIMAWLPTFLIESLGRSPTSAALLGALVVFVNVIGNLTAAWAMHRGVPRWSLIGVTFLAMGIAGALIFSPDVGAGAKVPLAIVFSTLTGLLPAACLAGAAAHSPGPGQIAMANGFVIQGAMIGSLLGPPVMGAIVSGFGSWEAGWWVMFIGPAIGLVLVATLYPAERRLAARAEPATP